MSTVTPTEAAIDTAMAKSEDTPAPTSTATTASATPSPASITYVVQPGDTLTYIARSFGTTVDALMAANVLSPGYQPRGGRYKKSRSEGWRGGGGPLPLYLFISLGLGESPPPLYLFFFFTPPPG